MGRPTLGDRAWVLPVVVKAKGNGVPLVVGVWARALGLREAFKASQAAPSDAARADRPAHLRQLGGAGAGAWAGSGCRS